MIAHVARFLPLLAILAAPWGRDGAQPTAAGEIASVAGPTERTHVPARPPGDQAPNEPAWAPAPGSQDDAGGDAAVLHAAVIRPSARRPVERRAGRAALHERRHRLLAFAPKTDPPRRRT